MYERRVLRREALYPAELRAQGLLSVGEQNLFLTTVNNVFSVPLFLPLFCGRCEAQITVSMDQDRLWAVAIELGKYVVDTY